MDGNQLNYGINDDSNDQSLNSSQYPAISINDEDIKEDNNLKEPLNPNRDTLQAPGLENLQGESIASVQNLEEERSTRLLNVNNRTLTTKKGFLANLLGS